MNRESYLNMLNNRYKGKYYVERGYNLENRDFDLYAEYNILNSKYFSSINCGAKFVENNEYCFVKYVQSLDSETINSYVELLISKVNEIAAINSEHITSTMTLLFITDESVDINTINTIENFEYKRSFKFGLNGWVHINIGIVSFKADELYFSRNFKPLLELYALKDISTTQRLPLVSNG